ncbi:hypothetical protein [Halobacillus sp. A5]|uniref:hypothetical protein n=1 Tax=Halobacillus sp. A5 TaxID=2880263 RepID=UPI0020A6BDF1|nr:hypothetical protein [Halobacillus sp. A5]MCP3025809.1 hypothetical protein [Halobacillus sp. A5]
MKFTGAYGECSKSDVSVCSSVITYEDKGNRQSFEVRYPESVQKEIASRFSIPEESIVHILSLACLIKYPEYKHRSKILLSKEEILLVFEDLNINAVQNLYRDIHELGGVEIESTLIYFEE